MVAAGPQIQAFWNFLEFFSPNIFSSQFIEFQNAEPTDSRTDCTLTYLRLVLRVWVMRVRT